MQALLFAALDTCPRLLLRSLAAPLRALLEDTAFREAAHHWIIHAISQPALPGEGLRLDPMYVNVAILFKLYLILL